MAQELNNCVFTVGGSYTNNVNFNLITQAYYRRATRTSSRTAARSDDSSKLVLEAERLRQSAIGLSQELKLTLRPPIEYNDLALILDEIAEETIPGIFRLSIDPRYHFNKHCEYRVLVEIAFMQGILNDFAKKRATDRDCARQSLRRTSTGGTIVDILWTKFWWLFYAKYLIKIIRRSLGKSRDKIRAALFELFMASVDRTITCHQIDIDDFFGAQWSLPRDLCLNRQVFFSILRFKYQGGPAELVVMSGQFSVFRQDGLRVIQALEWESAIKEGEGLQLSVLINRQSEDTTDNSNVPKCPQCGHSTKTISGNSSDGWTNCLGCNTTFNLTSVDSKDVNSNDASDRGFSWRESLSPVGAEQSKHLSSFRCFSIITESLDEDVSQGPENSNRMQNPSSSPVQIRPETPPGRVIPDDSEQDPIPTTNFVDITDVDSISVSGSFFSAFDGDEGKAQSSYPGTFSQSNISTPTINTAHSRPLSPLRQQSTHDPPPVDDSPMAPSSVDIRKPTTGNQGDDTSATRPPIGREVDPINIFGKKMRQSLKIVMGWQGTELPARLIIGSGTLRKLAIRVREQPVNFMIIVHQSLETAGKGLLRCRVGWKASRILLGEEKHPERDTPNFVKATTGEMKKYCLQLKEYTKDIKDQHRLLRTMVLKIYQELNMVTSEGQRSVFLARLSRHLSKDFVAGENVLRQVLDNLDEIEISLNLITRWWQKIDSEIDYLRMNGECPLLQEMNAISWKEVKDGFAVLERYFSGYLNEMTQLYDENTAKLNDSDRNYLLTYQDRSDLIFSKRWRLAPPKIWKPT